MQYLTISRNSGARNESWGEGKDDKSNTISLCSFLWPRRETDFQAATGKHAVSREQGWQSHLGYFGGRKCRMLLMGFFGGLGKLPLALVHRFLSVTDQIYP